MRISHVEIRSYAEPAPRQYVSETHDHKPEAKPPREINKMTAALAIAFGLDSSFTSLEQ
jgi:hypothetical protein